MVTQAVINPLGMTTHTGMAYFFVTHVTTFLA